MSTVVFKGFKAKILVSGSEVGRAQSVTVDINNNVDTAYEIGRKNPAAIIEGPREMTGTIERFWVDMWLSTLFLPQSAQASLPTFNILLQPDKTNNSQPGSLILGGVISENGHYSITQDGITADSLDFRAADYSWIGLTTITGPVP